MRITSLVLALCVWGGAAGAAGPNDAREAAERYQAGVALMQSESWDAAAVEFEKAVALDPLMVLGHYNLGQCRMALKDYPAARRAYDASREAFSQMDSLTEKERVRRERERRDEMNELKDSLARVHTLKNVNQQQITTRIEERLRLLESLELRGAERRALPAEIPLALGSAYFRQGLLPDAEREYKEAVRLNKKLGAAHNNLAVIYMMTKRWDEADQAVKAAEDAGFVVSPRLKDDLKRARAEASPAH